MAWGETRSIADVVRRHQCLGCGACAGLMPKRYRMVDVPDVGLRPVAASGAPAEPDPPGILDICPGIGAPNRPPIFAAQIRAKQSDGSIWGPILEIWEGHAADAASRWRGSSGGVVTALASFALASGRVAGVVQSRQHPHNALANVTTISRSPAQAREAVGSRYGPASPCDRLGDMANAGEALMFVGKPCDVQALAQAEKKDPALARNSALRVSIFCAGTPSTKGTEALLRAMGVPEGAIVLDVKYRGEGWPGPMSARYRDADGTEHQSEEISYDLGWGEILQKHRQWRCHLCADHTGEFADLSIGDPWDKPRGDELGPGSSLIVVRSERGRLALAAAIAGGAIIAFRRSDNALALAQPNLARSRHQLWGRLIGMRLVGLAAPRYRDWELAKLWWANTTIATKVRSALGAIRRARRRRLWRPETGAGSRGL